MQIPSLNYLTKQNFFRIQKAKNLRDSEILTLWRTYVADATAHGKKDITVLYNP